MPSGPSPAAPPKCPPSKRRTPGVRLAATSEIRMPGRIATMPGSVLVFLAFASPVCVAADDPVGSAYLRTVPAPEPPFGRVVGDDYPWDGVRVQRWRRDEPAADWLLVRLDLRT